MSHVFVIASPAQQGEAIQSGSPVTLDCFVSFASSQ